MKKILAVPILGIGLSMPFATLGSPIESGFDLFETPGDGKTFIDFSSVIKDGPKVALKGNPELLASEKLGDTDTIVKRKQGINPFEHPLIGTPSEGGVKIELVALSLKSIDSFDVTEFRFIDPRQLPNEALYVGSADLYVTVNALGLPNLPQPDELTHSTGSMNIDHKGNPDGFPSQGNFISNLRVFADLIFVIAGEDIRDEANWLASKPASDVVELTGKGIWTHTQPSGDVHNQNYPAGKFYVTYIEHVGPHQPVPANGCGPGTHWVDRCPAGTDEAPSTAVVTIQIPCGGQSQKMILSGPTKIARSNPKDAIIGHPILGNIAVVDKHDDVIETEMYVMELTGGGMILRAGDGVSDVADTGPLYSPGAIEELPNDPTLAKAFFEVFFELRNTPLGTLHNKKPHHMEAIIDRVPPLNKWHFPPVDTITRLYDENDKEVACLIGSQHRLIPPPPPSPIRTVYCVHDQALNDSQFCYGTPTPLVNKLGPLYEDCDIESLDIMRSTDDLYAAAGDDTPRKSHLYYVYKHNGDVVDLGDIGGPGFLEEIDALSFHPITDELWGWSQGNGLFRITTWLPSLLPPLPFSFPPSSFKAEPPFPEAIPIQPVVNINNPVCLKPTSEVPTIPADLVLNVGIEIEDITWNQRGDVLYGVENLHTDPVDSHGAAEDKWPYNPLHPNIDYEKGIKLWAYNYQTGQYKVVCPNLAPTIKEVLGNEAEIEGLESLPNDFQSLKVPANQDLLVVSFHGPKIIYYAGIITPPWNESEQCKIWIAPDKTSFSDIEGIAASPFPKPLSPPIGYPHFW